MMMKNTSRLKWLDILFAASVTVFFFMSYLTRSFLPFEHDTMFHCGRIAMLAEAIRHGNIFPAVYPTANYNYGYATPLFYCDFFNVIPALLCAGGVPLAVCYKVVVIGMTYISVLAMIHLMKKVSGKRLVSWLAGTAYLFSNYHITDVFVRGALGEIIALAFLPMILEKIYSVMYLGEDSWKGFALALAGLLMAHNLTFLFGVVLIIIFFVIRMKAMNKKMVIVFIRGVAGAFLLTVFFSLPMLEQLHAQTLRVSLYSRYYDLSAQTISFKQYFLNKTVYGLAGRNVEQPMLENIGWFLSFAPLLYCFLKKEHKKPFITACLILGYVFMLAPGDLLPWDHMQFLGFIQFPWRLNTLAMVLLCVPASYAAVMISGKRYLITGLLIVLLLFEGGYHLFSNYQRWYGITNEITWEDIRSQNGITTYDPDRFPYKYEELQGGEYLPAGTLNYRERGDVITDPDGMVLNIPFTREYGKISFEASASETAVLPLTWYKGYIVTYVNSRGESMQTKALRSNEGLVMVKADQPGTYVVTYKSTPLRKACMGISLTAWIVLLWKCVRQRSRIPV